MGEKNLDARIAEFLNGSPFAVVGASSRRHKYGNMVLRAYMQAGREAIPVNPIEEVIVGVRAYKTLGGIPGGVHGVSFITPPAITEKVMKEAVGLGIRHVWMQPGAESDAAIATARAAEMNVIAGGPCVLVVLGFTDH
ncbi:MAG TPA: CoA-binding protein [Phycisphaerales bacterium]|nr:CoA-binding protein [Phycisphaerales bacterium]